MITLWENVKEIKCSQDSMYTLPYVSTNQTTIAPISSQVYSNCLSNGTQVLKYLSMDQVNNFVLLIMIVLINFLIL
jgi:hypothetical protein